MARYATLERYRKAAHALRRKGLQPTATAVAKQLGISNRHIHNMLNKWLELKGYAGIVTSRAANIKKYEDAIHALLARGHLVTARAVADELGIRRSGAHKFLERTRLLPAVVTKMSNEQKSDSVRTAYRAAAERITSQGLLITRKALAYELGKPLSTVNQYLHSNPGFRDEIGVVYTDQVHGSAKNSREK